MKPKGSPLPTPKQREGGNSSPKDLASRTSATSEVSSADRFYNSLTPEDLDFAKRWRLTYDPPTDPNTRRYFRFAENSEVDLIETLPWPQQLRFCLPSALKKESEP